MNIFTRITLQSLKKNKLRTFMTILGVTLSVAMISGVLAFATSFQHFMVEYERQLSGDWYAAAYAPTELDLLKAKRDERTEAIGTYREIGYAKLPGMEEHYKPYLQLVDFDDTLEEMADVKLIEGRMPKNSGEVVLPVTVATEGGHPLKMGEKINVDLGMRIAPKGGSLPEGSRLTAIAPYEEGESLHAFDSRIYTVVGITDDVSVRSYNTPAYMGITIADESDLDNPEVADVSVAYIKTKNPNDITTFMAELFPEEAIEFNENLLMYIGTTHFGRFNAVLTAVSGTLIFLIMIGSIALLYNAFAITVSERIKEYGLLSSVGATKKQIRISVVTEGLLISILGIPVGMFTGVGGIWLALRIMGRFSIVLTAGKSSLSLGLYLYPPIMVLMVLLSLVTVLISVAIPARRASKIAIIDAIRYRRYTGEEKRSIRIPGLQKRPVPFEQYLSNRYFMRSGRRYRATIISLTLSITLFLSANFAGSYFLGEGDYSPKDNPSYNVEYMQMNDGGGEEEFIKQDAIFAKLDSAPGITYKRILEFSYFQSGPNGEGDRILLAVMSQHDYDIYLISLGIIQEHPRVLYLGAELSDDRDVDLYTTEEKKYDVKVEEGGVRAITINNVPPGSDHYLFDKVLVMSQGEATEIFGDYKDLISERGTFYRCENPEKTYAAMEKICREEGYSTINLRNVAGEARDVRNLVTMINVFAYGFVILISIIAIVNVFNTMSTNIFLRRREFAVLRAVGMTENSFRRMVGLESLIYGGRSLVLSLGISLIISILLYRLLWISEGFSYMVPWRAVIISIAIVFVAVFATMTYAAGKVSNGNLMDALKNENL